MAAVPLKRKYPTQYQKNGFEVQLLREKTDECQRNLFHQHFSTDPALLYQELDRHRGTLDNLKRQKVLKCDQYSLIFPVSKLTDSKKFDGTLLFLLIRTLCGYNKPRTGWDKKPDIGDLSPIADSVRFKAARNKAQHLPLSITRAEFGTLHRYLRGPLLRAGCHKDEIDNLMPSFRYRVQVANPNFVGRENQLLKIYNTFAAINTAKLGIIISGIPGVGKSELAAQYCEKYQHDYDHIIWISSDSIDASFKNIAEILQLHTDASTSLIIHSLTDYFKNDKVLVVYELRYWNQKFN